MSYFRFSGFGFVGKGGLEPPNSEEDRFTVCCNCHYATSPSIFRFRWTLGLVRADEGTRTPDRLITNQLLYQLSYIGFSTAFSNNSFLTNDGAKVHHFSKLTKSFFFFWVTFLLSYWFSILLFCIFFSSPTRFSLNYALFPFCFFSILPFFNICFWSFSAHFQYISLKLRILDIFWGKTMFSYIPYNYSSWMNIMNSSYNK